MLNIEIVGKFFDNHSLSIVNRNLAIHLKDKANIRCIALDEPSSNTVDKSQIQQIVELCNKPEFEEVNIQVRHSYPPIWNWPLQQNTRVVYIQPWEFDSVPMEWQYKFETFADLVVCPSNYNKRSYLSGGINPERVAVVANGYNPEIFKKTKEKSDKEIKVLFVGCNQFRKGLDILLHVWSNATSKDTNLSLTIKDTPNVYGKTDLQQQLITLQYKNRCAKIIYDDEDKTDQQMSDLFNEHHIVVHPYRGEGFGMHIQEAMACGCIPIVTEGGSTDDFVTNFKIPSHRKHVNMYDIFGFKPEDSGTLMGHHKTVLEPSATELANSLKHVIENLEVLNPDVSLLKTWEQVSQEYIKAFDTLINTHSSVKRVR